MLALVMMDGGELENVPVLLRRRMGKAAGERERVERERERRRQATRGVPFSAARDISMQ